VLQFRCRLILLLILSSFSAGRPISWKPSPLTVLVPSGAGACALSVFSVSSNVFRSPELIHFVLWYVVVELLQGDLNIALESADQKTQGFMVQIIVPR
jgi:hypothetical protein